MATTAPAQDSAYQVEALIAEDIDACLEAHQHKSLSRFITCGSVDDGKSTLIDRLLYESRMIFENQLAMLEADSKRVGTQGQEIDFALLVDGLAAEREQASPSTSPIASSRPRNAKLRVIDDRTWTLVKARQLAIRAEKPGPA